MYAPRHNIDCFKCETVLPLDDLLELINHKYECTGTRGNSYISILQTLLDLLLQNDIARADNERAGTASSQISPG